MQDSEASTANTEIFVDRSKRDMLASNALVLKAVRASKMQDVKKPAANGCQDSEILKESRASILPIDESIESRFRLLHYPNSRFWAVYDGNDLVAVTVYRRGAEEVQRRLRAAADLERSINGSAGQHPVSKRHHS